MTKNLAFLFLLFAFACNPLKKLEKVEAVIGIIPPVQIMGGAPGLKPEDMDPMRYAPYFVESLKNALNEAGIKTRMAMVGEKLSMSKPTQISIEMGMVSIHDQRPPILEGSSPDNLAGMQIMLMGGFGSVDKAGESVAKTLNKNYELKGDELAKIVGSGPDADPIKVLIDKAVAGFIEDLKLDVLEHIKKNK